MNIISSLTSFKIPTTNNNYILSTIIVCMLIITLVIYIYITYKYNKINPVFWRTSKNAMENKKIPNKMFNESKTGYNFTWNFWFYLQDWDYKFKEWKHIFTRGNYSYETDLYNKKHLFNMDQCLSEKYQNTSINILTKRINDIKHKLLNKNYNKHTYIGCFKDNKNRDLPNKVGHNSLKQCGIIAKELNKKYFGLQYQNGIGGGNNKKAECWVGNNYGKYGSSNNCKQIDNYMWGQNWTNAIYRNSSKKELNILIRKLNYFQKRLNRLKDIKCKDNYSCDLNNEKYGKCIHNSILNLQKKCKNDVNKNSLYACDDGLKCVNIDKKSRFGKCKLLKDNVSEYFPIKMNDTVSPAVYFHPHTNNIVIFISTKKDIEKFILEDINIKKWCLITIVLDKLNLDVYNNGKLAKTFILKNAPKTIDGDVFVNQDGGFNGQLSSLSYSPSTISPNELQKKYNKGPTQINLMQNLLIKLKLFKSPVDPMSTESNKNCKKTLKKIKDKDDDESENNEDNIKDIKCKR